MEFSAQNQENLYRPKTQVLVTDVGSYLGVSLAKSLLSQNCEVFGLGSSRLVSDILQNKYFTLLELDLNQPLPSYLPQFDLIFHLDLLETKLAGSLSPSPSLSLASSNVISQAKAGKSHVFIFAPITVSSDFYEYIARDDQTKNFLKLFLIGDLYGPGMPLVPHNQKDSSQNELLSLISQAVKTDKVILENEGLNSIYPAYITDVIFGVSKLVFSPSSKNIHILVSEETKTALSVAYEIQNAARIIWAKELGLFFAGARHHKLTPQPIVGTHNLDFLPKVKLGEGLKNTFEYFAKETKREISQDYNLPFSHHQTPIMHKPSFSLRTTPEPTNQVFSSVHHQELVNDRIRLTHKLTSKIPQFSFKPRIKTVAIIVVVVLFLIVAKTALDIFLGLSNIKNAKASLIAGDFKNAKLQSQNSANSFKAAANKTKFILLPLSFIFPKKVESTNRALAAASIGANATAYFIEGSQALVRNLSVITSKDTKNETLDLETPAANFKRAYFQSAQAFELMKKAQTQKIFKSKIETAQKTFYDLNSFSQLAFELTNLTSDLTGSSGHKTYLILLQNNTELRPGGGFIGNFGLVELNNGRLQDIKVDDIYTIDGQLQEKIEPPKELKEKLGIDRFYLRDSNWSGDFQLNSATARDFFKKETGKDVDGVISIDLVFVQNLLVKLGPVNLSDYNEQITADNLFERGEYYSEIGFFPGSTQKRDFFGSLSQAIIERLLENLAHPFGQEKTSFAKHVPPSDLIEVVKQALEEKHLMLTFDSPNLTSYIATHGWNHPLPPVSFNPTNDSLETRDFLALSEANLGANKVNRFLERVITYEMTIGRDADLVANLTIVYTNNSQAETWPGGKYVNFLRIYVPFTSSLIEYKNGAEADIKKVEVTNQTNVTTFATFVEVPVRSTRQVTFTYRIPKNIKLEKAPTYHLYVQKQPGTDKDPFDFKFNLPGYLTIKSVSGDLSRQQADQKYSNSPPDQSALQAGGQNLITQTDLSTDRQFVIEIAKK